MWSGGTYTKSNAGTGGWTGDAVAGIAIDATRHDTQDNDFAAGINQCLTKDGQNSCTADLNFGGFRPSNVAGGSAAAPAYTANNDTDTGAFSPAANAYAIATGGVERVRVSSTGKVGIGTTAPFATLDVASSLQIGSSGTATNNFHWTAEATGALQLWNGNYGAGTERMRINASAGATEVNIVGPQAILNVGTSTTSTQVCAMQIGAGRTGIGDSFIDLISDTTYTDYALRIARYAGTNSDTSMEHRGIGAFSISAIDAGFIKFNTSNNERMRISATGFITIGPVIFSNFNEGLAITPSNGSGIAYLDVRHSSADVGGNWYHSFTRANVQVGTIASSGTTGVSYNTTSDYRLKSNVQPFPNGLSKVKALSPSKWEWSTDNSEGFGFIAHELQSVIPEAVTGTKDAVDANGDPIYQAVDYGKLTTVLVAAVKELTAKVESLEARIAVLEGA
jgi:hypothetical protein